MYYLTIEQDAASPQLTLFECLEVEVLYFCLCVCPLDDEDKTETERPTAHLECPAQWLSHDWQQCRHHTPSQAQQPSQQLRGAGVGKQVPQLGTRSINLQVSHRVIASICMELPFERDPTLSSGSFC